MAVREDSEELIWARNEVRTSTKAPPSFGAFPPSSCFFELFPSFFLSSASFLSTTSKLYADTCLLYFGLTVKSYTCGTRS
jgi:hypothetical protein